MIRKSFIAAVTAATFGTALLGLGAAPAAAQERTLPNLQQAYPNEGYTQYRRYYGRRDYGRRDYGRRHYGRSYRGRDAAAAGIAGLAAGALIGGALASQQALPPPPPYAVAPGGSAQWIAYCSQKYRSFDPGSGTYLGYDGQRHMCQ